jgi:hypothetical protein
LQDLADGRVTHQQVQEDDKRITQLFNAVFLVFLEVVSVERFLAKRAHDLRLTTSSLRRKPAVLELWSEHLLLEAGGRRP